MKNIQRHYGIDIMRLIGACFITAYTTGLFSDLSKEVSYYILVLAKIVPPFFFIVTGYYYITGEQPVLKLIKRFVLYYLFWSLVYLYYDVNTLKHPGDYWKYFLFSAGHFHLWFLPALVPALFILSLFKKRIQLLLYISLPLFIIGMLGESWLFLFSEDSWFRALAEGYKSIFITTYNGLFMGLPFVTLGAYIAAKKVHVRSWQVILLLLLFYFEVSLVKDGGGSFMFISLLPLSAALFLRVKRMNFVPHKYISENSRDMAVGIYFIHDIIRIGLLSITAWLGMDLTNNNTIVFLLVLLFSFLASWIMTGFKKNNPWEKII